MAEQVSRLQQQVDELRGSMSALRQETVRLAPIQPVVPVAPLPSPSAIPSLPLPRFRVPQTFGGPTSIAYTVETAKSTLQRLGYSGPNDDDGHSLSGPVSQTPPPPPPPPSMMPPPPATQSTDPMWDFDKDEMLRLCSLYEEELALMCPIVSVDTVLEHAANVASWMDHVRQGGRAPADNFLHDSKGLLLRIIMACALAVEEHGNSARADQLYGSIEHVIDKKLMSEPAKAEEIPILALCAGYRFLSGDEVLAWRTMGLVTRLCFELGLHRREGLAMIADPNDRRNALHTFWSAYMLDRRWSFSSGLPFSCQDDKIDPKLPFPENNPYLIAMIKHARLAAKVWKLVDYFEPAVIWELKPSDFEDLDREVLDWYDTVSPELRIHSIEDSSAQIPSGGAKSYDLQRLRIWIRLRYLQMRTWLYTPVLHSATSIVENESLARKAVELAKETIRALTFLNNKTNLYRRLQVFYHQFLTSAISVLFLASTHAPIQFSATCRTEFYLALELIKGLSARSWVSQRLWRTVGSLKAYARQVGMEMTQDPRDSGSHSFMGSSSQSPASGSAYTTSIPHSGRRNHRHGEHLTPSSLTPSAQNLPGFENDGDINGLHLQSEIQRIYEDFTSGVQGGFATGTTSGNMSMGSHAYSPMQRSQVPHAEDTDGGNETVYEQMKNMF